MVVPSNITVLVRGGGDLASGTAWRLHRCGFKVLITEIEHPLAVRRTVSFCEAVFEGRVTIEGVAATLVDSPGEAPVLWAEGEIPVLVDPQCEIKHSIRPQVLVDGIMAKRNLGTSINDAPLVVGLGPGFTAGRDVHYVVETNRGHFLGRVIESGRAEPDTGTPGPVMGITRDRVIHAPLAGKWKTSREIGAAVRTGDEIGTIDGTPVTTAIDGVLRGAVRGGINVEQGMKLGDVDPRGIREHCFTISDKALAIAGGVLEAVLRHFNGEHL
ncbi:MAG TPA: EF2563 family selenium-dependent molybdenum hydroxylase system protein [Desulfobacteraceae bacterium]|nr:EF2563 family selenium-dependent molybdenum hydroxylase system protein [Desulfobacteraceae bacterium]